MYKIERTSHLKTGLLRPPAFLNMQCPEEDMGWMVLNRFGDLVSICPDRIVAESVARALNSYMQADCSYCNEDYAMNQLIDIKGLACPSCAADIESGDMEDWLSADYNARCTV